MLRRASPLRTLLRVIAILAALVSLAFDGGFRGCDSRTEPGAVLPGGEAACTEDAQCPATACSVGVCTAGRCGLSDASVDADRDGAFAAPCGGDCDDGDPRIAPTLFEGCDGLDNDCDGSVDEGAFPTPVTYAIGAEIRAAESVPTLPGVLLVSVDPAAPGSFDLVARWFDLDPSGPFALLRVAADLPQSTIVASLPAPEGARIFWHDPSARTVVERSLTVSHTDTAVDLVASPTTAVLSDVDLVAMRARTTSTGYALLLLEPPADGVEGNTRSLFVPGQPRQTLPSRDAPLDLVTRGTRFYTPVSNREIAVLDAAGAELARVEVPGELSPDDPLTDWNERVFALVSPAGATEFSLHEITAADSLGGGVILGNLAGAWNIAMHPVSSAVGVTYTRGFDLELDILRADLGLGESYTLLDSSPTMGLLGHRSLHETSAGLALVHVRAGASESAVVHLRCRP
jgi:hypothetical protein